MLGKTKGFPVQFLLEPLNWALQLRPLHPSTSFSPPFLALLLFVFFVLSSSHFLTLSLRILHFRSSLSSSLIFCSFSLSHSSYCPLYSRSPFRPFYFFLSCRPLTLLFNSHIFPVSFKFSILVLHFRSYQYFLLL